METVRQAQMLDKTMLVPFWKSATQHCHDEENWRM